MKPPQISLIFKRTDETMWPENSVGGLLKVTRIYKKPNAGLCGCCEKEATAQIVLHDTRFSGGACPKTTLFACTRCTVEFTQHSHKFSLLRNLRWEDGWEVPCDYCYDNCPTSPVIHQYTPWLGKDAGIAARFANMICEDCKEMESLFA
jgi:hypothetical protein